MIISSFCFVFWFFFLGSPIFVTPVENGGLVSFWGFLIIVFFLNYYYYYYFGKTGFFVCSSFRYFNFILFSLFFFGCLAVKWENIKTFFFPRHFSHLFSSYFSFSFFDEKFRRETGHFVLKNKKKNMDKKWTCSLLSLVKLMMFSSLFFFLFFFFPFFKRKKTLKKERGEEDNNSGRHR